VCWCSIFNFKGMKYCLVGSIFLSVFLSLFIAHSKRMKKVSKSHVTTNTDYVSVCVWECISGEGERDGALETDIRTYLATQNSNTKYLSYTTAYSHFEKMKNKKKTFFLSVQISCFLSEQVAKKEFVEQFL
jgi:hypothetical protein